MKFFRPKSKKIFHESISKGTLNKYWINSTDNLINSLRTSPQGLSSSVASFRQQTVKPAIDPSAESRSWLEIFWNQIKSPLIWILFFASMVSIVVQQWTEASVILVILIASTLLGFFQEYHASTAIQKLLGRVQVYAKVLRDGKQTLIPHSEIVPGDVVMLSAGSLIPADGILLECKDLFMNESLLTGETMPAEKQLGVSPENSSIAQRANCVFMGTSVRNGSGKMLVVFAGAETEFGKVAKELERRYPETEFEKGLNEFGFLLTRVMFIFLILIFVANILLSRPFLDSLLFAVALAVGISPELLPAILSVTLARGAQGMAKRGVLIKRLSSIENLGSMDILCSDKTGTLTTGVIHFQDAVNVKGEQSAEIRDLAWLNSYFQTGLTNPLDEALLKLSPPQDLKSYKKIDEVLYDFTRKRLTVIIEKDGDPSNLLITKGAASHVLAICSSTLVNKESTTLTPNLRNQIEERIKRWGDEGVRVLALATRGVKNQNSYSKNDEADLMLRGFLLFNDEIHLDARNALGILKKLGVKLKIMTGDNRYVSKSVAAKVGLQVNNILTGEEINGLTQQALQQKVLSTELFVELDPSQKEIIVEIFKSTGHVVGFLGDGINDAPALRAADVGMSVESAVDVAKEAADVVFTKANLRMLALGISEGRVIFANTLKYIFTSTSANFGNMISMACASLFLPFLPLLASQVLLNNFLADIPALFIGTDRVDRDWQRTPHRWNISVVRKFMVSFGLVSSLFDFVTFGFLLFIFRASTDLFRTGWFMESLLTELVIIYIVRTFKRFYKSKPSPSLMVSSVCVATIAIYLPYSPVANWMGFVPLSFSALSGILCIVFLYALISELTKTYLFHSIE
ncbi:MAG: magnesium-translocating P-type ATPase [Pseudobdellovibrionaceae bacterium]